MSGTESVLDWPAVRVTEAAPDTARVPLLENLSYFLRLEPGAKSEVIWFRYWTPNAATRTGRFPAASLRITADVKGPAILEDAGDCYEVLTRTYASVPKPLSESTIFAARTDKGHVHYLQLHRRLDDGDSGVRVYGSGSAAAEPLYPAAMAVGETHGHHGRRLRAERWVDVSVNARRFRCIELINELAGAEPGEVRHDRHYIASDGAVVLRLRYNTVRAWEGHPDVEPREIQCEGCTHFVEWSIVPSHILRESA